MKTHFFPGSAYIDLGYYYSIGCFPPEGGAMLQLQDVAYFFLIASIWTSVLAVSSPGTGMLELSACVSIVVTAVFAVFLGVNVWGLALLGVGFLVFLLEIVRPLKGIFLLISVILFSAGSVFLFRDGEGGMAVVSWPLAVAASLGTAGFFWLVVRNVLLTYRNRPAMDPSAVIGQSGIAETEIHHSGSVLVASESWSARSDTPIPAGSSVRVTAREGLVVTVEREA
jgi:membrane-bound serine protease (ClpP class)